MATQTLSSTTAVAVTKPQDTEETIYSCKWGNVTILNRQNYSTFAATCQYTLIIADAWGIVMGTEPAPANINTPDGKDWKIHQNRAIQIIYNSVSKSIHPTLTDLMDKQDTKAL